MKVIALAPLAAVRSISATEASTSQNGTSTIGMNRSGAAPHHSSMMKSFHAWTQASARSLSSAARNVEPAKPGNDGKHICTWTPSMSMSARRAVDVVAARQHVVEADRVEPVVLRVLAGDGVQPDRRQDPALEAPRLGPAVELDDLRARLLVLRRQPVSSRPAGARSRGRRRRRPGRRQAAPDPPFVMA